MKSWIQAPKSRDDSRTFGAKKRIEVQSCSFNFLTQSCFAFCVLKLRAILSCTESANSLHKSPNLARTFPARPEKGGSRGKGGGRGCVFATNKMSDFQCHKWHNFLLFGKVSFVLPQHTLLPSPRPLNLVRVVCGVDWWPPPSNAKTFLPSHIGWIFRYHLDFKPATPVHDNSILFFLGRHISDTSLGCGTPRGDPLAFQTTWLQQNLRSNAMLTPAVKHRSCVTLHDIKLKIPHLTKSKVRVRGRRPKVFKQLLQHTTSCHIFRVFCLHGWIFLYQRQTTFLSKPISKPCLFTEDRAATHRQKRGLESGWQLVMYFLQQCRLILICTRTLCNRFTPQVETFLVPAEMSWTSNRNFPHLSPNFQFGAKALGSEPATPKTPHQSFFPPKIGSFCARYRRNSWQTYARQKRCRQRKRPKPWQLHFLQQCRVI